MRNPSSLLLIILWSLLLLSSCSVMSLCNPKDCSTPGFPVLHQLPEFTQTHVYWVGDAIQTSHPLSSPSLPAFDLSQHQSLFQWVSSSPTQWTWVWASSGRWWKTGKPGVLQYVGSQRVRNDWATEQQLFALGCQSIEASASASVFPMNTQDWFPLGLTDWISLQSKGLSRVFPNTTVQKHQLFDTQPSLWSNSHIHTWLLEKT